MKYRVEIAEWVNGSGFSYNEEIDSFDEETTAEDYIEICADGPEGILKPVHGDDLEVRIIDNETNEVISQAWVGDIYSEWYGTDWRENLCDAEDLFGEEDDVNLGGVYVMAKGGVVREITAADVVEMEDTPENRAALVADAKALVEAWKR